MGSTGNISTGSTPASSAPTSSAPTSSAPTSSAPTSSAPTSSAPRPRHVSPALAYTAGRLGLFVVVAGALYLIGFRSWFLVLLALLLSMPLSYFVLRRPRMAFARRIEQRGEERRVLRAKLRGDLPPD